MQPIHNDDALGNAWFVKQLSLKNNDDEVMQALEKFKPEQEALATANDLKTTLPTQYTVDTTAKITLKNVRPDELIYESNNPYNGLAVFSEMYYPHGWKATIDGKEASIHRVDYTLRALSVPAGKHEIRFAFEPQIVKIGSILSLVGGILLFVWLIGGIVLQVRKNKIKD